MHDLLDSAGERRLVPGGCPVTARLPEVTGHGELVSDRQLSPAGTAPLNQVARR